MDNVLIDRSASGFDFRHWTDGDGCRSRTFAMSLPPPRISHSSFGYSSLLPPPQFQCEPYLNSSLSLPALPPRRPPLLPLPPAAAKTAMYATAPPPALATTKPASVAADYYKRKKPRAPMAGDEPPRMQRRRKPLERAAPLPPALAVGEALDDLEREVVRGFVQDLVHVLAPPPSSLPLPTFSLVVRAAATKVTAAAPCAV